ncbi:sulfotransferase family protein [Alphaproteobacteria bacterium]|nr:sulfotransferase family protein [Alphaproteobacteria bacterium]
MLPKPLRLFYYWLSHQGKVGYWLVQLVNWSFIQYVRIFKVKPKRDLTALTIVSHKYKFIYIGIPKTATRAFLEAFALSGKDEYGSEWFESAADFQRVLRKYPDYFKFSFTRNPYARIVSCYNSKIDHDVLGKQARILCFYDGLSGKMGFGNFAKWLESDEGADAVADRHWLSQHAFLYDGAGQAICDYVGQYENLEVELAALRKRLGLPEIELEREGYISETRDYRDYYDDAVRARIARRYAKDLELFGYEF